MIILLVGIILILYGLVSKQKYSVGVGMFFVFLIMGFQENCITDYPEYKSEFLSGTVGYTVKETEFAFRWLWGISSSIISFHAFVMITSLLQCIAMGYMIKEYAERRFQYFGVLLVFFTFNIMLIQMTAMRQGYAVDVLLFAYLLLGKRKYIGSLITALIAYGFHNSALIALLFFIFIWGLTFLNRKEKHFQSQPVIVEKEKGMKLSFIVLVVFAFFYLLKYVVFVSYINPILEGLDAFSYSGYFEGFEKDRSIAWWIMLYNAIILFCTTLYYASERNRFKKYLAFLTIVYVFLNVGTFGFGNLMRTTLYFIIFTIVVFPNVSSMLRNTYGKRISNMFVVFNMFYLMFLSVRNMLTMETDNATGFGSYMFSFFDW